MFESFNFCKFFKFYIKIFKNAILVPNFSNFYIKFLLFFLNMLKAFAKFIQNFSNTFKICWNFSLKIFFNLKHLEISFLKIIFKFLYSV